jgi:hypothetical protein
MSAFLSIDRIPLAGVPRALAALAGDSTPPPTYAQCYRAAVNAAIPTIQGANGRYVVERARLPEIARLLGLRVPTTTPRRRRRADASAPAEAAATA